MLSSPSETHERVMVKFVALPGSIPSVLRELVGVIILISHAVKFETAPVVETWKSGELRSVILYIVILLAPVSIWRKRGFS